jgi:DUF4097 and DUF4098 domain-containing protein YvlB
MAGLASWNAVTGGLWRSVDQHQVYAQGISSIAFEGGSGDVEIRADSTSGQIAVDRRLSWGLGSSQPAPDEQVQGTVLRINEACRGFVTWCSIDYVLHVPEGTDVTLNNGSGDVALSGNLGTTQASTGSGDLDVSGSGTQQVRLETGSGDIGASRLAAKNVVGHTGSGSMDLEFVDPPSDLALQAGSGDVSVRVPRGAYAVDVETGSGDTENSVGSDPSSQNHIVVKTGSGDVEIAYS